VLPKTSLSLGKYAFAVGLRNLAIHDLLRLVQLPLDYAFKTRLACGHASWRGITPTGMPAPRYVTVTLCDSARSVASNSSRKALAETMYRPSLSKRLTQHERHTRAIQWYINLGRRVGQLSTSTCFLVLSPLCLRLFLRCPLGSPLITRRSTSKSAPTISKFSSRSL